MVSLCRAFLSNASRSTWGKFFSSLAQLSGFQGEAFFKGGNLNGPASSSLHDTYLVLRVLTVGREFHES